MGGKGAFVEGTFVLFNQTVLSIEVGQRGGDSVEARGGQTTTQTAAELGLSVEDNSGTVVVEEVLLTIPPPCL